MKGMRNLWLGAAALMLVPAAALAEPPVMPATALPPGQTPDAVDDLPSRAPVLVEAYGTLSQRQRGELRLPDGEGPFPVAIVVHGGCWTKGFATERNTAALAGWLADNGVASWNIDYRELGDEGGGWPGTFADWAAGTDHLRSLAKRYPLDLERVSSVGHSAGATAALWIAMSAAEGGPDVARANPVVVKRAAVLDGPLDLAPLVGIDAMVCGQPVIAPFMGGTPEEQPARFAAVSLSGNPPQLERLLLVGAEVLPGEVALGVAEALGAVGLAPEGAGHFDVIAPGTPGFAAIAQPLLDLTLAE
jgi:acetyl esterase/lipase